MVGKNSTAGITLSPAKLRCIALMQQGLLKSLVRKKGSSAAVAETIGHLGYVQIDTISVVERAHHHVLWSRVKDYKPQYLDEAVAVKKVFEYWFHAAAYLPIDDFRFALPRMNAIKSGEKHWFDNIDKKLLRSVYRRIETEGALRARDFKDTKSSNTGWWDWKPAKQAIEKLFMQGDLMVVGREGFQKRYDLTERVLPGHIDTSTPDTAEQARYLIDTTLRSHGFANLKSYTYLRKGKALRVAVRECIEAYLDEGKLVLVQSINGDEFYCDSELLESKQKPRSSAHLLSPFDNLVIQRERGRQIFDFDYQIECYVPAAKRQYGYFCLPILYKDKLIGRMDCKADRRANGKSDNNSGVLNVQYLQYEKTDSKFLSSLTVELKRFMQFNGCASVVVKRCEQKSSKVLLQKLLAEKNLSRC